ncbi:MAG: hypothetical protein ACRD96_10860, partial [Bryobacteraceae bacterium]
MSKRRHKLEPIRVEEITDSPSLEGYDAFLRYRPSPIGTSLIGDLPIGESPISNDPVAPIGGQPISDQPMGNIPIGVRRQKVRRAVLVQDGHSVGEQLLYLALWNHGAGETADSRLITIGYGGMQELCKLDRSNCKKNLLSLIEKLAVEITGKYDIRRNTGNKYRVYSYAAILRRRKEAGLEYVVRSSGVRFVAPPIGGRPIGDEPIGDVPIGASPMGSVGEAPTGAMGESPRAFRKVFRNRRKT